MSLVKGIDVSYYDDIINWSLYDNDFAFIKCSEGTVIDKVFKAQWAAAKGHTIRAAYTFFRSFVDPIKAAGAFADYLDGDLGELPPIIDLEAANGRADAISISLRLANEFRRITHVRPMIYSSPGFLSTYHAEEYTQLEDYKLWLAQYPFDEIRETWSEEQREKRLADIWEGRFMLSFPVPPRPFRRVSFWQFTGKGNPNLVHGYQSSKLAVDMNFYHGEHIQDMFNEFSIKYVPRPNNGGTMNRKKFKVVRFTNIRNGPYESYVDIGDLLPGSIIETVDETIDAIHRKWYRLDTATNPQGGPVITKTGKLVSEIVAWCFDGNLEEILTTPEPEPEPTPVTRNFKFKVDGYKEYSGSLEEE